MQLCVCVCVYLRGDNLNGSHEAVSDDRYPQEHVEQRQEVDDRTNHLLGQRRVVREPNR